MPLLQFCGVPEDLIQMVIGLYDGSMTKLRTPFSVTRISRWRFGSIRDLSPLLFIIVRDFISKQIKTEGGTKLIYADDIALVAYIKEDLVQVLDAWNRELTNYSLRMNKEKTKVMGVTMRHHNWWITTLKASTEVSFLCFSILEGWLAANGEINRDLQARLLSMGRSSEN